jgi:hypothetical protein
MKLVQYRQCVFGLGLALCSAMAVSSCGGEEETPEPVCDTVTNSLPTPPIVSISPSDPSTHQDIEVSLVDPSTDADEDNVSYRFRWLKNGEEQADYEGQTVIPAAATAKGELWKVQVWATDGYDDGYPGGSQVTIANTVPTATATLMPEVPTTSSDLLVTVEGVDEDEGDTVTATYAWSKNGTLFDEVAGGVINAEHTTRGDVWQVIVTPTDGEDDATPITLSVSIANEAPMLNSDDVSLSPFNASGTTDLSVVVANATDADDDSIQFTYTWAVGTTTLGSETGSSLSSANFEAGETVKAIVTPYDGTDYGTAVEVTKTIGN